LILIGYLSYSIAVSSSIECSLYPCAGDQSSSMLSAPARDGRVSRARFYQSAGRIDLRYSIAPEGPKETANCRCCR
jgi:hypothetical protein